MFSQLVFPPNKIPTAATIFLNYTFASSKFNLDFLFFLYFAIFLVKVLTTLFKRHLVYSKGGAE